MKKITCLLSLLLLCAGAMKATAQGLLDRSGWTVTTSGECDDSGSGHAAAITDGNTGTFWHSRWNGAGNASGDNSFTLPQFFQVDLGSEQTFQTIAYLPRRYGGANGDAKAFKVYVSNTPFVSSGSDGKIVYGSTTDVDNNAASIVNNLNASDLYIDGTVDYSGFTKQTYIFKSGTAATTSRYLLFVVTSSGGEQPDQFANCAEFQLVNGSVADAENLLMPVQVTYNYYINDALYKSVTVSQNRNSEAAAPAQDFINNFSYDVTSVGTEDCTVRVNCNENLPFVVTTDLNNAKWYAWRMHSNQSKFLSYSNNKVAYADKPVTDYSILSDNAYFWCITGNLVDGFKVYNKAVGTTQSLSYAAGDPVMSAEDANNTWKLVKSTANSNWFCLQRADMTSGNKYMNLDLARGLLTYWNAPDPGSSIFMHTPASFPVNYVESYVNAPFNAVGSSTYFNEETKADALTKIAAARADEFDFNAAQTVAGVADNVANGSFVEMAPGYYRIYSAVPGLYARNRGLIYDSNNMRWNEVTKQNVNNIVKLEAATSTEDAGKYYLYACNAKKYMQGVLGALGETTGTNSGITVTPLGSAQYNLEFGNGTMHANEHGGGSGEGSNLVNYAGSANSASAWYIVPATDLEVALNTVDGTSYASAYLPFPVQGEGIYTGAINGNGSSLDMTAQTGVIPAETGMVIKSADTKATLTIGGTADANVSANDLTGSLTAVTENLTSYLVLGVSNDNTGIGFFTPSERLTTIAANKAYLLAAEVPDASHALAMNFGGEATGVGTVITENGIQSNAPVFDLSGRRVMQTVKGGLYIQNGKKFIVK